ncbi:MAG: sigma-70 family RNA polymerase sigma factor [Clostridia bacterium]|nr:sigma-70 family RNA polymerase sigma factor [Clostridia bacterium]
MNDRDRFIAQNIGLVHTCCHRFRGRGIEYEDLFQAGCVGLIKAADHFEADRGLCFSTYAVPVILGEIRRMFRDGGAVKVSRSVKELSLKITAEKERYLKRTGNEISVAQLADTFCVTKEEVAEAICAAQPTVSLVFTDESGEESQLPLSDDAAQQAEFDRLVLRDLLDRLEPKDRQLIELRYFGGKTQSETARQLGMTQVQVSRKEKVILLNLRRLLS